MVLNWLMAVRRNTFLTVLELCKTVFRVNAGLQGFQKDLIKSMVTRNQIGNKTISSGSHMYFSFTMFKFQLALIQSMINENKYHEWVTLYHVCYTCRDLKSSQISLMTKPTQKYHIRSNGT